MIQSETISNKSLNLSALTYYIVHRYHDDLRVRFPVLIGLADKVEHQGLAKLLSQFFNLIQSHMEQEESVLFPLINNGEGILARTSVTEHLSEHDAYTEQFKQLREMTDNFKLSDETCSNWVALYVGLEKLEQELDEHLHLEERILYPLVQKLA